jgi:hypothetical protein
VEDSGHFAWRLLGDQALGEQKGDTLLGVHVKLFGRRAVQLPLPPAEQALLNERRFRHGLPTPKSLKYAALDGSVYVCRFKSPATAKVPSLLKDPATEVG